MAIKNISQMTAAEYNAYISSDPAAQKEIDGDTANPLPPGGGSRAYRNGRLVATSADPIQFVNGVQKPI